jgi:hypothetical protein
MYVYECQQCGGTSDPFITRRGADRFGDEHGKREHGGLHPIGECVLQLQTSHRAPQGREWMAVAATLILIGAALLMR